MSLSVVISTFNRQEKLQRCLLSIKDIADEIIVVDNTSSDDSVKVAKTFTPHVFIRKNNPMLNVNKNFGFTKASKEWILYLDDDESITSELGKEITEVITNTSAVANGYWIPRKNSIFGKWIEHTGWYPDYQLRLFRREKGKFPEVHVHEMVAVEGSLEYLSSPMEHTNYESIHEFLYKMVMTYAPNEAEVLLQKGYKFDFLDSIRFPAKEFFSRYFARQGYKDGLHGLVLSLLMAFYHLIVFGYLWEKHKFVEVDSHTLLPHLSRETRVLQKELRYWEHTKTIETTKNPLKKVAYKIVRKLTV